MGGSNRALLYVSVGVLHFLTPVDPMLLYPQKAQSRARVCLLLCGSCLVLLCGAWFDRRWREDLFEANESADRLNTVLGHGRRGRRRRTRRTGRRHSSGFSDCYCKGITNSERCECEREMKRKVVLPRNPPALKKHSPKVRVAILRKMYSLPVGSTFVGVPGRLNMV